ncbi:MAG: hypothetical protein PHS46_06220 [Candidatus Omnitrophica bacterium]|nr:hypothetical protein [Candidatus Omnitrophota bacterium]
MKKKFEDNVAADIPKTKLHEPNLPWKLTEDEVGQISPGNEEFKDAISGTPPLKTRAPFLILLVVGIFGITTYMISSGIVENGKIHDNMSKAQAELSAAQLNLVKTVAEKDAINKNSAQLEKKVSDLMAQKKLFANVIETLTRKGEDIDAIPSAPVLTMTQPVNASSDNTAVDSRTAQNR